MILFMVAALTILFFRPPSSVEKPEIWMIVLSCILTLDSIFHIGSWMIDLSWKIGIVGAPFIQIGLVMALIGSIVLLITSFLRHRNLPP
jgi:hypothetical protein